MPLKETHSNPDDGDHFQSYQRGEDQRQRTPDPAEPFGLHDPFGEWPEEKEESQHQHDASLDHRAAAGEADVETLHQLRPRQRDESPQQEQYEYDRARRSDYGTEASPAFEHHRVGPRPSEREQHGSQHEYPRG